VRYSLCCYPTGRTRKYNLRNIISYFLAALKKFAKFSGRAQKAEYWFFVLFQIIIVFLLAIFSAVIAEINSTAGVAFLILFFVFLFGSFIPQAAVTVRRLHDTNRGGWNMFFSIGTFRSLLEDGTSGPNQYGPDPKEIKESVSETATN